MKSIYEETRDTRLAGHDRDNRALFARRIVPGRWIIPELLNGWENAGDPYEDIAYRRGLGSTIEFRGHIQGGASGSVAFIIPTPDIPADINQLDGEISPLYSLLGDVSFLTDIVNGVGFSVARVYINNTTGEVTITFPAT